MKTYIWAVDAGHEWLAVKRAELVDLGIADQITEYSYVKGSTVYLEGDVDAATFIDAYTKRMGAAPKTKQGKTWDVQPLRRFARYSPTPAVPARAATPEPQDAESLSLNEYIERANRWSALFKQAGITFPLSQSDVNSLVDRLNGDLSPENLHCDGEISASAAQKKYRFYQTVARELEAYCARKGLLMGEVYEL